MDWDIPKILFIITASTTWAIKITQDHSRPPMITIEHLWALMNTDEYGAMSAHNAMSANNAMGSCSLMLIHAHESIGTLAP